MALIGSAKCIFGMRQNVFYLHLWYYCLKWSGQRCCSPRAERVSCGLTLPGCLLYSNLSLFLPRSTDSVYAVMVTHHHEAGSAPVATGTNEPKRVEELWFDDGNLILKAENSLFRVYGGFLAARSSVFRDMLTFPPPEEGNATFEGCPIVTVYDVAPDLTRFLKAIFDSRWVAFFCCIILCQNANSGTSHSSYFEPPPTPTDLATVESILRLSLKYDVQYLKRRAISHLNSTFPMTLTAWRTREKTRTIPPVDNTPFAAFRTAKEFDLDWILPSILYCISSHPIEKTLDHAMFGAEKITLKWADKRLCVIGRQKLLLNQSQSALQMARTAHNGVDGCTGEICAATRLHCADVLSSWDMAGFLDYFEDNACNYYDEFCPACRTAFICSCGSATQQMWDDLPTMFDLPSWEDLEKTRVTLSD